MSLVRGTRVISLAVVEHAISNIYPVLISLGTNVVCALAIKPGLRGINELFPTLLSPNGIMLGLYWAVLFMLMVGFCLVLLLARKDVTKVGPMAMITVQGPTIDCHDAP